MAGPAECGGQGDGGGGLADGSVYAFPPLGLDHTDWQRVPGQAAATCHVGSANRG